MSQQCPRTVNDRISWSDSVSELASRGVNEHSLFAPAPAFEDPADMNIGLSQSRALPSGTNSQRGMRQFILSFAGKHIHFQAQVVKAPLRLSSLRRLSTVGLGLMSVLLAVAARAASLPIPNADRAAQPGFSPSGGVAVGGPAAAQSISASSLWLGTDNDVRLKLVNVSKTGAQLRDLGPREVTGVAIDSRRGRLFLSQSHSDLIEILNLDDLSSLGTIVQSPGVLWGEDMAFDGASLYRVDVNGNRVWRIDPSSGAASPFISGYPRMVGIAWSGSRFYVSQIGDASPRRITEFGADGAPTGLVIDAALPGNALLGGLAWDLDSQSLWVASDSLYNISVGGAVVGRFPRPSDRAYGDRFVDALEFQGGGCSRPECINSLPVIISLPPLSGQTGVPYIYNVKAIEPGGSPLRFALPEHPFGMVMDSLVGVVTWTPADSQVAAHRVVVQAHDDRGNSATQPYYVAVARGVPDTIPPAVTLLIVQGNLSLTGSEVNVPIRTTLEFQVNATDNVGVVDRSLTIAGQPVVLDAQGRFTQQMNLVSLSALVASAHDAAGNLGSAARTLRVYDPAAPDSIPPAVTLLIVQGNLSLLGSEVAVPVGTTLEFRVDATDNVGVVGRSLTIAGQPVALNALGRYTQQMTTVGLSSLVATAHDSAGNVGSATRTLRVYDPNDNHVPTVTIISPKYDSLISKPTDIVATITDPILESYTVDYARADQVNPDSLAYPGAAWTRLGGGTTSVTNGVVGQLDPTILINDSYIVRVSATNTNLRTWVALVYVGVFSNLKLGEFRIEFTDLSIPVAGVPIQIKRIYDSRQSRDSRDFGYGWSLGIADARITETLRAFPSGAAAGVKTMYPGSRVYINTPDGRRVGFTAYSIDISCGPFGLFGCLAHVGLQPDPGVYEKLDLPDGNQCSFQTNGNYYSDGVLGSDSFNPSNYRLTLKDGTAYTYSQTAGLQLVTDLNGNHLNFGAAGIQHFSSGQASSDQHVDFVRDAQGRITSIVDPNGKSLIYTYDGSGDLRAFRDQVDDSTRYSYNTSRRHYLDTIVDPLGHRAVRTEYDADGRIKSVTDALGHTVSEDFNLAANTGTFTDANGHITVSTYDDQGNVVRKVDPEGGATEFHFDASNNEIWRKDPRNFITQHAYDSNGNVTLTIDPLGNQTAVAYNVLNKPIRVTDALGDTTHFEYDVRGGLTGVVNALARTSTFVRDAAGRVTSVTDFNGHTTTYDYAGGCSCGKPHVVTNPDMTTRTYEYNAFGQTMRETDELGHSTVSTYDDAGRLVSVIDAEMHTTGYTYDAALKKTVTDPLNRTTSFAYDASNRQISITDPANGVVRFEYDNAGNRVTVTDPVGNVTRFGYDQNNHLVQQVDPLNHSSTFVYDPAGNRREAIDRNGRRRTFEYDGMNRRTREQWWDGGGVIRTFDYTFNALGIMTGATDPASALMFTFDALNRLAQTTQTAVVGLPDYTLTYDYDGLTNVVSTVDNWGVGVQSEYDSRNRLSLRAWHGGALPGASLRFAYDAAGRRIGVQRYADSSGTQFVGQSTYRYNGLGAITRIQHTDGASATLEDYRYSRDAAQQITRRVIDTQTADYVYDLTGQLTSAQYSSTQPNESHAYDDNGNRRGGGFLTDTGNRLLTDGTYSFAYDAEGSLVTRTQIATGATTQYDYDYRNRLARVVDRDSDGVVTQTASFTYDAMNHRIAKQVDGGVSRFIYDRDNLVAELTASGALASRYLMNDRVDGLLARYSLGNGTQWYITDNIGTVRAVTDSLGRIANSLRYSAFGELLDESVPGAFRFGLTGREWDSDVQLYFLRARYYSPRLGRFMSEDPIGYAGGDYNLYRYVQNEPIGHRDPFGTVSGLEYGFDLTVASIVAGTVSAAVNLVCQAYNSKDGSIDVIELAISGGLGAAVGAVGFVIATSSLAGAVSFTEWLAYWDRVTSVIFISGGIYNAVYSVVYCAAGVPAWVPTPPWP